MRSHAFLLSKFGFNNKSSPSPTFRSEEHHLLFKRFLGFIMKACCSFTVCATRKLAESNVKDPADINTVDYYNRSLSAQVSD